VLSVTMSVERRIRPQARTTDPSLDAHGDSR
jgi:hypothetical protein